MEGPDRSVTGRRPGRARWDRTRYPLLVGSSAPWRFFSAIVSRLVAILGWPLSGTFYTLRLRGRRNLPKGPCILVSNHTMYLDPLFITSAILPKGAYFTGQTSHFAVPIGGTILRYMRSFPIPPHKPMERLIPTAREILRRGWSIHFFAEGRMRLRRQVLQPFRRGAFEVAVEHNVPVVPISLVLRYHRLGALRLPYPPRVIVAFGPPVRPSDIDTGYPDAPTIPRRALVSALRDRCHEIMTGMIATYRGEDRPGAADDEA